MGDVFHDSSSNQSAINRQIGIQGGGTGSSIIAAAEGSNVTLVDPGAFKLAHDTLTQQAVVIHDALGAITTTANNALLNSANIQQEVQQVAHDAFDVAHSAISSTPDSQLSGAVAAVAESAQQTQKYLLWGVVALGVAGLILVLRKK